MKEVYEQYYTQLVYFGLKMVRNNQVVEDIVIDCILKFFEYGYPLRLANVILYKCVKHKCINYLRSEKTHEKINAKNFNEEYIGLRVLETRVIKLLNDALDSLSQERREVLVMFYLEEKTCAEIAKLLNKNPSTVRSLKKLGLESLFNLKHLK